MSNPAALPEIMSAPDPEYSAEKPITVSLVEDNAGTRESLLALLASVPHFRRLGVYSNGEDALKGIINDPPAVALVDINLPGISGIECVAKLKRLRPDLRVLMLTTYSDSELIFDSLRAGASGYVLKNTPADELVRAIEQLHAGGAPMSMQIARKVVDHFQRIEKPSSEVETLTPREREILALLARGFLYKEIGTQLGISLNTVKIHVRVIYDKLHVQSRAGAAIKFFGKG